MPKSINQLDVKLTTCNSNMILLHCITPTESVKDLGIIVDPSLKYHIAYRHTSTVTARANQMLALINKSFEYLSTNMLLQLYKSFVRTILEYVNTVWGPMFVLDQQSVEKIQRRDTKLVREIKDLSYCMLIDYTFLTYRPSNIDMLEMT